MRSRGFAVIIILTIVLTLISVAAAYLYVFNKEGANIPTPVPGAAIENNLSSTPTPDLLPASLPVSGVKIPSNWKSYTATDPDFGVKTTMFLPPEFSFRFTGSEFTVQGSDALELWDYSTSVTKIDGKQVNSYKEGSRRQWYAERLANGPSFGSKEGEIKGVKEVAIGSTSYLEIIVQPAFKKQPERHYLIAKNGVVNVVKPVSDVANSSSARIPKDIDKIFFSLEVEQVKPEY